MLFLTTVKDAQGDLFEETYCCSKLLPLSDQASELHAVDYHHLRRIRWNMQTDRYGVCAGVMHSSNHAVHRIVIGDRSH